MKAILFTMLYILSFVGNVEVSRVVIDQGESINVQVMAIPSKIAQP